MSTTWSNSPGPAYIPALSLPWLTPLYDAAMATIFQEWRYREPLAAAVAPRAGATVLDIGCGTGTMARMVQQRAPGATVIALDIDPHMVLRAQGKMAAAGAPARVLLGSAAALPVADGALDLAYSSLVFHHLPTAAKRQMLADLHRALKPGAPFYLMDFGPPTHPLAAQAAALLAHFEHVADNLHGRIPLLLTEAGFERIQSRPVAFGGFIQLTTAYRPTWW